MLRTSIILKEQLLNALLLLANFLHSKTPPKIEMYAFDNSSSKAL